MNSQFPLRISIVVPVYNSSQSLAELIRRLAAVLDPMIKDYEVILINDGSRDNSWEVIQGLAQANSRLKGINLSRNFGQHNALLCGIRAASFEVIVTIDDDLQNPPEEIPKLLSKLEEGFDVVYGTPNEEHYGFLRGLASFITKLALKNALGIEAARKVSAFRAFRTSLRKGFEHYHGGFVSIDALLAWVTKRFAVVEVRHDVRQLGQSNYTVGKLILHAVNMATGFSTAPLQVASLIGFGITLLGFLMFLFVVGRYLIQGGIVPGFAFLAAALCIFSGTQLFCLGVIGEYLSRMHFRLMGKPSYHISESVRQP